MSQDRFLELVSRELMGILSPLEESELAEFIKDRKFGEQYNLYKLYFANNTGKYLNEKDSFAKIMEKAGIPNDQFIRTPKKSWNSPLLLKVASILLVTMIGLFFLTNKNRTNVSKTEVTTKIGTKKSLILSDGTRIVLNASSKLIYPKQFKGDTREVTLVGEAFFDVSKDHKHPFIIHTDKMNVRVLGTAFNIKSYPDDAYSETTLIRGVVEVTLPNRGSDKITLRPSEKLIVKNPTNSVSNTAGEINLPLTELTHFHKNDTTVVETSWLNNAIAFNDESLEEIAKLIERAHGVTILFENENKRRLKFTGNFGRQSPESILKALSMTDDFTFRSTSGRITIK